MLVSDHPHLFESGGENYHTDFTAWDYVRGHEGDPWRTVPDPSWVGTPALPARAAPLLPRAYDTSRTWFRDEGDFPGPRVMATAADWLDHNAGRHDRFLLVVDEFDPHEPFDTPEPWAGRYDPDWEGDLVIWPPYAVHGVERGVLTEREGLQIRANYGAKLSMIDHWFGRVLDALDRNALWDDTAVIVCTDHGHYLGEKDIWGKPAVMQYEPLGHMPLLVAWPGVPAGSSDALTTTVDLHATLTDVFGVTPAHRTHGRSLAPVLEGAVGGVREWVIGGVFGNWVQVTDGRTKYARAAEGDNYPLSLWSNRWSTMPIHGVPELRMPRPDRRATLDFMPHSDVPVLRQPFQPGDMLPYWVSAPVGRHHLFDLGDDPDEQHDLAARPDGRDGRPTEPQPLERAMLDLLVSALDDMHAPDDQYARLGLR
jgi:arylsulfatase A-like enzyme